MAVDKSRFQFRQGDSFNVKVPFILIEMEFVLTIRSLLSDILLTSGLLSFLRSFTFGFAYLLGIDGWAFKFCLNMIVTHS